MTNNCYDFRSGEKVELFYHNVFVEIQGISESQTHTIPTLYHSTHYSEMIRICQREKAIFKGNPKQWRSYSLNGASSIIDAADGTRKMISHNDTECLPGPLLWFATTQPGKYDNVYGPLVFGFQFTTVLDAYQKCRGINSEQLCYRAAGTLVYQREVSHVVLVCATSDDCYQTFPLIQGNNTKYFTPPSCQETGLQTPASMTINKYPKRLNENIMDCTRHHHVSIAFYLPNRTQLILPNKPHISELQILPHSYCMKNRLNGGKCYNPVDNKTMEEVITIKWDQCRQPNSTEQL